VPDLDHEWRESEIYRLDVASGQITQLTNRKGPDGQPAVSPDGKLIAYTGFDHTTDTWKDSELYLMNADGSNVRRLTPTLDRSPQGLIWAKDGSGIYFMVQNHGSSNLMYVSVAGGAVRTVTEGAHLLSVESIDRTGTAFGVRSTFQQPNDIVTFNVNRPEIRQLTAVNDDLFTGKELASIEEVWYPSVDGFRIQGWIVKPPGFDRGRTIMPSLRSIASAAASIAARSGGGAGGIPSCVATISTMSAGGASSSTRLSIDAPASIHHSRSVASSSVNCDFPLGGMCSFASSGKRTRLIMRLAAESPGLNARPVFPPFNTSSRASKRRSPLLLLAP
jgi:hypothetical protein